MSGSQAKKNSGVAIAGLWARTCCGVSAYRKGNSSDDWPGDGCSSCVGAASGSS